MVLLILSLALERLKTGEVREEEVWVILVRPADTMLAPRGGVVLSMVEGASLESSDPPGLPAAGPMALPGVGGVGRGKPIGVVADGVVEGVWRGVEGAGVEGAGVVVRGVLGAVERLLLSGLSMVGVRPDKMPDTVGRAGPLGFMAKAFGSSW